MPSRSRPTRSLTRTGARVGLITTRGFRDVLEIGRLRMPQLYDMGWDKPVPLVRRSLRLEVAERMSATGEVVEALDEASVIAAIDALLAAGVESIAVCLLHSYVNPAHERRVRGDPGAAGPGPDDLGFVPGAAGDPRVRAHQHDGGQCLRQAGGRRLSRTPGAGPGGGRRPRAADGDAVGGRRDDSRPLRACCRRSAWNRVRPRGPSAQRRSAGCWALPTSLPSTWAAPQPRPA